MPSGQRIDSGGVNVEVDQAVTGEVHGDTGAGSQANGAFARDDQALVGYLRTQQADEAAVGRGDGTTVEDGRVAVAFEGVVAGHEIAVGDVQGRGDKAADVDGGVGTEHHAGLVDQEDVTVRGQATENR